MERGKGGEVKLHLKHIASLPSTNAHLMELLDSSDIEEGTVVWVDEQTQGKGLQDNTWESEIGKNLTFSIALHPSFLEPSSQFQLSKMISLALIDFLQQKYPSDLWKIKWPNDIYFDKRKIAGILIENKIIGNEYDTAIVGVGLNINQKEFFSSAPNPVSLIQVSGKEYDLQESIQELFTCIAIRYSQLQKQPALIDDDYLKNLLQFQTWAKYKYLHTEIKGCITGVDMYGYLQIETSNNKYLSCDLKEIKYLWE